MILLCITIDKYLYIAKPLKYPLIVRTRRTRILLSCIWLAASEFVLQPQQSEQVQSEQNMTWLRHLAKELKAMKTFAIIVGVLTFCFVPYIVTSMLHILDYCVSDYPAWFQKLGWTVISQLVGINSIANAFIYALRHKKYIRAYKKLFSSAWARLFPQNN